MVLIEAPLFAWILLLTTIVVATWCIGHTQGREAEKTDNEHKLLEAAASMLAEKGVDTFTIALMAHKKEETK